MALASRSCSNVQWSYSIRLSFRCVSRMCSGTLRSPTGELLMGAIRWILPMRQLIGVRYARARKDSRKRRGRFSTVRSEHVSRWDRMADSASWSRMTCLAAVDCDDDELMLSSSGRAFSVLARRVIARGGVVYGHAFDDGLHVGCVRAESFDELSAMRGSKYVQSDMSDAIASVGRDLGAGREVLFSGTPCQVDGLLAFLGGPQDGLLTVDIICHGVPSQAFFADCMGEEFSDRLLSLRFRDKREGWGLWR